MWQFWVDRGGTFTDTVAKSPKGDLRTHKLLSENPEVYQDAAVHGIREILDLKADAPVPTGLIEAVKMGTTVATNALFERKGEKTVLFITKGMKDLLLPLGSIQIIQRAVYCCDHPGRTAGICASVTRSDRCLRLAGRLRNARKPRMLTSIT